MPGAEEGGPQQVKGEAESPPPSSFPVSSPSFWAEAASIPTPATAVTPATTTAKRALSPSPSPDPFDASRHDLISPPHKRTRRSSGSPGPDSPTRTTLTFLPNPQSIHSSTDPHAYLAGDEYAANKFGDIGDYKRKKEIKIQAQNASIAGPSAGTEYPQIFAGMSFHINGNTHPPMEQLRKIILQRGGVCYPVLRNKGMVDYIIAPVLTMKKHKEFASYKVVREAWVVDSAKEGKLLDWRKWKLIVEEGWEASSRKGMEGFFGGKGKVTSRDVSETVAAEREGKGPEKSDITVVTPTQNVPIITTPTKQRLLTPHRPIPISPGQHPPSSTTPIDPPPLRLPPKVQQPEGAWEHYYTKTSNEHAQKAMQSDEWRARNTAERGNDGGFIDGYYQNSRLHHLSMWKAELRVLVKDAQKRSEEALAMSQEAEEELAGGQDGGQHSLARAVLPSLPLPAAPSTSNECVIFHVDFDAFFVSCGLASRPHLRGKPSVVCHSTGKAVGSTSEIASCSYEARAKGVKNGMSLGRARELVGEELQTMPYEFETYKKFSLAFYTILMGYADDLQAVSVDEALIDVTSQVSARAALPEEARDEGAEGADGATKERDPAVELAEKIRDDVRKVTDGCEVSMGISHNILLAKLATRHAKPAGVFHMLPSAIPTFLAPLDVADFPSVGHSTKSKIQSAFGTTTVGDLLGVSRGRWKGVLGEKTGDMVWGYCRGLDNRKLEGDKERKSVSAEMNYGIRFKNQEQAEKYVVDLAAEVTKRMKNVGVKGRMVTLKLMKRHPDAPIEPPKFMGHGWCETFNRSSPLLARGGPTDDPSVLADESVKLLRALRIDPVELRGVGIQVTKLDSGDDKNTGEKDRPAGQGVLHFTARPRSVAQNIPTAEAGPSRPRGQPPVAPKSGTGSSSGIEEIDPEFLAALPPSLRSEVKRDHARMRSPSRGRSRAVSPPEEAREVIPVLSSSPPMPVSPEAISPSKGAGKASGVHEAAHIARQLRPRGKTQMRAGVVAAGPLFGAWAKAGRKKSASVDRTVVVNGDPSPSAEVVDLTADADVTGDPEIIPGYTHSHLRTLGIDPSVLLALPAQMQKEVIAQEERNAAMRRALYVPGDRSREVTARMSASLAPAKAAAMAQTRGRSVSRSVPPVAAVGRVIRPAKPVLMGATEVPDVLDTITLWVESRKGGPPAGRDAGKVGGYLKKCVEGGMGGVESAVEVLRWMRVLLREKWGSDEEAEDGEDAGAGGAGKVWWRTWREMRDAVVGASEQRFGAGLKI